MHSESLCTQNDKAKDLTATLRGGASARGTTPTEQDDRYQERTENSASARSDSFNRNVCQLEPNPTLSTSFITQHFCVIGVYRRFKRSGCVRVKKVEE